MQVCLGVWSAGIGPIGFRFVRAGDGDPVWYGVPCICRVCKFGGLD